MTTTNSGCKCNCGDRGWIPLNSTISVNKNNSINIQAPLGWAYIGKESSTGQLFTIVNGGTSVSCTCNATGSCLPFVGSGPGGDTAGCAGDCTNCTMKQSAAFQGGVHVFSEGGYIDLTAGITFAQRGIQLPAVFEAMLDVPEIQTAIIKFFEKIYEGKPFPVMIQGQGFITAPDGYEMVVVNMFGRATIIPVPIRTGLSEVVSGGTASCSCTQGSCTAKSHSVPFVGSVTYCEGDCAGTCTLSCSTARGNGVSEASYTALCFKF
jgi:hypothetical protein